MGFWVCLWELSSWWHYLIGKNSPELWVGQFPGQGTLSCIERRQQTENSLAFLVLTSDCRLLHAPAASISLPCKLYPSTIQAGKNPFSLKLPSSWCYITAAGKVTKTSFLEVTFAVVPSLVLIGRVNCCLVVSLSFCVWLFRTLSTWNCNYLYACLLNQNMSWKIRRVVNHQCPEFLRLGWLKGSK